MKNLNLLFLLISIINLIQSLPLDSVSNFYVNSTVGSCKGKQLDVSLDVCNNGCSNSFKITSSKDNVNNYNFTSYIESDDKQCSTNNYTINLFNCSIDNAAMVGPYSVKCIFKETPSPSNSSNPSPSPNTTTSSSSLSSSSLNSNEPNQTTKPPKTNEPQKNNSTNNIPNFFAIFVFLVLIIFILGDKI
ncbi:hypothetical protein ACTFIY_011233 [Dictyostelium cf. discoideum]